MIGALNHSILSMVTSSSFSITMTWLSLASSTAMFNKPSQVVMLQLTNEKLYRLTKKQFAQILKLTNTGFDFEDDFLSLIEYHGLTYSSTYVGYTDANECPTCKTSSAMGR
ncbi:unnamed protein product [Lactuca saligna]|uniref:Uncharacterized protein n=1 Tax=Lactuca saligna TaxID=75948 RepID=A0AA36EP91_LACSI|nr:unnamed protein product [Lactuca saligna]